MLQARLQEWAHPDAHLKLEWHQDADKSVRVEEPLARIRVGEGSFEGDLARLGHGLQRSYILALVDVWHTREAPEGRGFFSPARSQLYQHPPQTRHLANVLTRLATPEQNAQVIVCTHSPFFVAGEYFESVRFVQKDTGEAGSKVTSVSATHIMGAMKAATGTEFKRRSGALAKVHQALQPALNEMFFTPRLILVEGREDVAYIMAYLAYCLCRSIEGLVVTWCPRTRRARWLFRSQSRRSWAFQ